MWLHALCCDDIRDRYSALRIGREDAGSRSPCGLQWSIEDQQHSGSCDQAYVQLCDCVLNPGQRRPTAMAINACARAPCTLCTLSCTHTELLGREYTRFTPASDEDEDEEEDVTLLSGSPGGGMGSAAAASLSALWGRALRSVFKVRGSTATYAPAIGPSCTTAATALHAKFRVCFAHCTNLTMFLSHGCHPAEVTRLGRSARQPPVHKRR